MSPFSTSVGSDKYPHDKYKPVSLSVILFMCVRMFLRILTIVNIGKMNFCTFTHKTKLLLIIFFLLFSTFLSGMINFNGYGSYDNVWYDTGVSSSLYDRHHTDHSICYNIVVFIIIVAIVINIYIYSHCY